MTTLTWGLLLISIVVMVLVTGLVTAGVLVRRAKGAGGSPAAVPLIRGGGGMGWLAWGVGLSLVTLAASVVWTVAMLAQINGPLRPPPLTVEVGGVQWWWRARYPQADPRGSGFETANELHVPVGVPVRFRLRGEDVIHSFWPPALTGKTDAIHPGRPARAVRGLAAQPGAARGRARRPAGGGRRAGVPARFASCHTVRAVSERGRHAPDLTHVASRPTLAAGAIPNTTAGLSGWISDPQAIEPGNRMPTLYLSAPDLQAVTAYLMSLK